MYGIYANIWGILMVNVTIYSIHGSYGSYNLDILFLNRNKIPRKNWSQLRRHIAHAVDGHLLRDFGVLRRLHRQRRGQVPNRVHEA